MADSITDCLKNVSLPRWSQFICSLPRTPCSSQNNFPMLICLFLFLVHCICTLLEMTFWSPPWQTPHLLQNSSLFTWFWIGRRKSGQATLRSIFQSCISPHFDISSCYDFHTLKNIFGFFSPHQSYKVPFLRVTRRTFKIREAVTCSRSHNLWLILNR